MNRNVPIPRAGGNWLHDAKTGALVPADAAAPAVPTQPPAVPAAPPKAQKPTTKRNRAPE